MFPLWSRAIFNAESQRARVNAQWGQAVQVQPLQCQVQVLQSAL